jgi:hypothetical protein
LTAEPIPAPEIELDGVFDIDPEQEVLEKAYSITSYGADFLVDGLVTRMSSGDILVPGFDPEIETGSVIASFQRDFVWKKPQIDRFIESLLLGFPVPGIFLVREPSDVLLVLDGQQRLRSLAAFLEGELRGEPFKLEYVEEPWRGLRYRDLDPEDRRRLDNSIIHATIVRQDRPPADYGSVYSIFERLNTGGTPLQPQEIRVALFRGPFINLLRDLNAWEHWRTVYGPRSNRLKDQELILRFFALLYRREKYARPLKGFLNDYLEENRDLKRQGADELGDIFRRTSELVASTVGRSAFRPQRSLNAAVFDSVMVGLAERLRKGDVANPTAFPKAYERLLESAEYQAATESSTAAEESVEKRTTLATRAFARLK